MTRNVIVKAAIETDPADVNKVISTGFGSPLKIVDAQDMKLGFCNDIDSILPVSENLHEHQLHLQSHVYDTAMDHGAQTVDAASKLNFYDNLELNTRIFNPMIDIAQPMEILKPGLFYII